MNAHQEAFGTALLFIAALCSTSVAQDGEEDPLTCITCLHNEIKYGSYAQINDPSCVSGSTKAASRKRVYIIPKKFIRGDSRNALSMDQVQEFAAGVLKNETISPKRYGDDDDDDKPTTSYCAFVGIKEKYKDDYTSVVVRGKVETKKDIEERCEDELDKYGYYYCLCRTDRCNNQPFGFTDAAANFETCCTLVTLMLFSVLLFFELY